MESNLTDRATRMPEVSPDDVWGDVVGFDFDEPAMGSALPPKRNRSEKPSSTAVGGRNEPLRIDLPPQYQPNSANDRPSHGLEVQEINGSVLRLTPEESENPRMPRQIAFHERQPCPKGSRSSGGETREWGRAKKQSAVWILGTSVAVATMVVGTLMLLPMINESNAARPSPGQTDLVLDPEEALNDSGSLRDMLAQQTEAERIYTIFASALTPDDILPLLRDSSKVTPLVRAGKRPPTLSGNQRLQGHSDWGAYEKDGHTYGILKGALPDHSPFNAYFVISGGILLMDWKASTAYGTASFEELEQKLGNPDEIRCWISPSDFYTLAFPEHEYQSYQLVSPDQCKAVWCYGRRGEAANAALGGIFKAGGILAPKTDLEKVTLRLSPGPADGLPNQWLIVELLHKDWICP